MQNDIKRTELLVQVARLYYEHNLSQNEIAKKVNLSRTYISKLLYEAKQKGIVKIEINDPVMTENGMERKLREFYKLDKVIVVPAAEDKNPLYRVGEAAARYLNSIIKNGDVIGFSWGETVYECAKALNKREDLNEVVSVQMCGGISNIEKNVYVSEVTKTFSEKLNSTGYVLPFPAIVDNEHIKTVIDSEQTMQKIYDYANRANIAILTMGKFGQQSALARADYLKYDEVEWLLEKGAVGDICTHIINERGELCDQRLDARTVAISYERIKQIETRIGVATGESKVNCIFGALSGGVINVFITDEKTVGIMKHMKPEIFD